MNADGLELFVELDSFGLITEPPLTFVAVSKREPDANGPLIVAGDDQVEQSDMVKVDDGLVLVLDQVHFFSSRNLRDWVARGEGSIST
jgi:hypothetical protein